jgi:8-oxo-dGTP diphosphatase
MAEDGDRTARVPLGPVGRYVITNLKRLREERELSYRQVSDRLKQIGRPIPTLGLSRIENGNRRVDADDLVALAVVLEVSPGALLLPPDAGVPGIDDEVELTANLRLSGFAARQWMAGHSPLPGHDAINWPRPAFIWRVRDAEMEQMRQRLNLIESALQLERARNGHDQEEVVQPVVTAIVTSPLGVLVGHRNDGKPPWTFIAGEQEPGERVEDTAIREVKEETGLRIQVGEVIGQRVHPKTQRTMIYLAARPTHGTDVIVGDEEELAEVRWVSLAEAEELMKSYGMFEPVRAHLAQELGEG